MNLSLGKKHWPVFNERPSQITRVLVCFPDADQADSLIQFGVQFARRCQAQIRGLSVVDTTRADDLAATCESAAHLVFEQQRLQAGNDLRDRVRASFTNACLEAGVDFDLRHKLGRPRDVLREESRFHDLSLIALSGDQANANGSFNAASAVGLVLDGVSPLLVLRGTSEPPQRVLLVQDGSLSASRALRSYLSQGLFANAQHRLLAIGDTERSAERALSENVELVARRLNEFETGYTTGRAARLIPDYARQWEADLVVMGVRNKSLLAALTGDAMKSVLENSSAAVYATC